ncbi:MAG: hypothetical protein QXO40_04075 [Candidatus Aenigmatarchaeota archaeon]
MCCETEKIKEIKEIKKEDIKVEQIQSNVFEIGIPINLKDKELSRGKYRLYFDITKLNNNQILFLFEKFGGEKNKEFKVLGKRVRYIKGYGDRKLNYFIAEIEIIDNPIPVSFVVGGLITLLGGILAYSLLVRIEKIIEVSKPFAFAITLIAIIILINIFR